MNSKAYNDAKIKNLDKYDDESEYRLYKPSSDIKACFTETYGKEIDWTEERSKEFY